jgi:hypothetical protein
MHRTITTRRFAQRPRPEFMLSAKVAESVRHACKLGFEGIVSKRLGSPYVSSHSRYWIKSKNPAAPAVKREAEEDWDRISGEEMTRAIPKTLLMKTLLMEWRAAHWIG